MASVVADHYSTPSNDEFEAKVRNFVNDHNKALSIHSLVRIHSRGSNLIQVTDLLIGAVNYEFKLKGRLIKKPSKGKVELLRYIKQKLNTSDLTQYIRSDKFNLMTFDPHKKRT